MRYKLLTFRIGFSGLALVVLMIISKMEFLFTFVKEKR